MKKSKYQLSSHSSLTSVASSIKCSLSLQQRQLSYHPILICLECLLPAVSYWVCCMMICRGCFPFSFTLHWTVFIWHIPVVLGRLSVLPHAKLPEGSCSVKWTPQLPQRSPRPQTEYAPSNLNETEIFAASNQFYLYLKSRLFSQSNPPSASTQRKHSWRLWNQRWGIPAVDHRLVKTLFIHSCELPIKKWCCLASCHLGLNVKLNHFDYNT